MRSTAPYQGCGAGSFDIYCERLPACPVDCLAIRRQTLNGRTRKQNANSA
jgi:hypothetical protein